MKQQAIYPFSAIVGQDDMRLALLLNAVNPAIGGVLIRGEKGTAKSTAVRALAALLPDIEAVAGCPWPFAPADVPNDVWDRGDGAAETRPAPLVNLPLGVTEDRLLGTIDLERALQKGERHFDPGLLADAHQGILYIDEVNLLGDHIVDVLLDSAAMGVNIVEREGISASHPARFILIGTMNPEEGDLRPQLLDRFGLAVEVAGSKDKRERAEIVRRRLSFEANNGAFGAQFAPAETETQTRIISAQQLLPSVILGDDLLDLIAAISLAFEVDGMRADLVMYKTARTLAAWDGRTHVTPADVSKAAELTLLHRRRRQPFEQAKPDPQKLGDIVAQHVEENQQSQARESETETEGD